MHSATSHVKTVNNTRSDQPWKLARAWDSQSLRVVSSSATLLSSWKKLSLMFTLNLPNCNCGHCYCSVACYYKAAFGSIIFSTCPSSSSRMPLKRPLAYSLSDWASPASSVSINWSCVPGSYLSPIVFPYPSCTGGAKNVHRIPGVASPPPKSSGIIISLDLLLTLLLMQCSKLFALFAMRAYYWLLIQCPPLPPCSFQQDCNSASWFPTCTNYGVILPQVQTFVLLLIELHEVSADPVSRHLSGPKFCHATYQPPLLVSSANLLSVSS